MSGPSFRWMTSRAGARELAAGAAAQTPSRPCLPAVEALGDRVMLSVSVPDGAVIEGPAPVDRVLIGLIKGELDLANSQLAALKLAGGDDPQLLHKLTQSFIKIGDAAIKIGESLIKFDDIKGESKDDKHREALALLDRTFLKLDALVADDAALKQAVEGIKLDTGELIDSLLKIGSLGDLSHKDQQLFLKITDVFDDATDAILKLQQSVLENKVKTDSKQDYLIIKFSDLLVSSLSKVDDPALQKSLQGLVAETERILTGLLQPPETDDTILT